MDVEASATSGRWERNQRDTDHEDLDNDSSSDGQHESRLRDKQSNDERKLRNGAAPGP